MRKFFIILSALAVSMVSVACAPAEFEQQPTATIGGYLNGGDDFNSSGEVVLRDVYDRSVMEIFGTMPNGDEVMARVDLYDGPSIQALEPGTYVLDTDGGSNFAVGCSGASRDAWNYDVTAQQTTLVVADGEEGRQVDYALGFENEYDHLSGSVFIPR